MSVKLQAQSVRNSVERSGTGQACPGLVVEKSGTGIDVEKSGTGIDVEKSGTGRRFWPLAVFSLLLALAWPVAAADLSIGLTLHQGDIALVARGESEVLVGSAAGELGYYRVPIYSISPVDLQSEGSGSGTTSEGSGSGTTGVGSCSGTASEGSGSGTTSEGSGSGTTSEGSGSGTTSEGSGSGSMADDDNTGCNPETIQATRWGHAEVVITSAETADVILYQEQQGHAIEHSVHGNIEF